MRPVGLGSEPAANRTDWSVHEASRVAHRRQAVSVGHFAERAVRVPQARLCGLLCTYAGKFAEWRPHLSLARIESAVSTEYTRVFDVCGGRQMMEERLPLPALLLEAADILTFQISTRPFSKTKGLAPGRQEFTAYFGSDNGPKSTTGRL